MGAENSSNAGKIFYNVFDGKFAVRVKEGTPNAVTRENKMGKQVHELHYDTLSNMMITSIKKEISDDYGASWQIGLQETDEKSVLNLSYSGRVTNGLFFRLPNIDLGRPVTLKVFKIADEKKAGKFKQFLTVEQDNKKVEPFFTKDAPNGLPQLEQVERKGKMEWDDTNQMKFIEKMLEESIIPKLSSSAPKLSEHVVTDNEPTFESNEVDQDELPF